MAEQTRRIKLVLRRQNPQDAEIMDWLESLPQTQRGTELRPHLTLALLDYVRKQQAPARAPARSAKKGKVTPTPAAERTHPALGKSLLDSFS